MAGSNRGQRVAKRRRASIRLLGKEQGRDRPINTRHMTGTKKKKKKKEKKPTVIYQLVLTRGPSDDYYIKNWVDNIMLWCEKTDGQARAIIKLAVVDKHGEGDDPPVLATYTSMSDAQNKRFYFDASIMDAIDIVGESV